MNNRYKNVGRKKGNKNNVKNASKIIKENCDVKKEIKMKNPYHEELEYQKFLKETGLIVFM